MSAKRKTNRSEKPADVRKLHSEYNLEKVPLQTGETAPRTTWRERSVMGLGGRGYRSLVIIFWLVLILIIGSTIIRFVGNFFTQSNTTP